MITGTVKWMRDDGTGYINGSDGIKYYLHISEVANGQILDRDTRVTFVPHIVLGRHCAFNVIGVGR